MKKLLLCSVIIVFGISCSDENKIKRNYSPSDYQNILNIQGNPVSQKELDLSLFLDKGTWFGYALSEKENIGFTGPYSLNTKQWILRKSSAISCFINDTEISFSSENKLFIPGQLSQTFTSTKLKLKQEMIYGSANHAVVQNTFINKSADDLSITVHFTGNSFIDNITSRSKNRIRIKDSSNSLSIQYSESPAQILIKKNSYEAIFENVVIPAGQTKEVTSVQAYSYPESEIHASQFLEGFDDLKEKNEKRWTDYLNDALAIDTYMNKDSSLKKIGVKSVVTMISNWRKKAGDLNHDGLFPSYAYSGFHGFWAWDSWKHAAALASFHPGLAKSQILAMYDYQTKSGMIPDCIYTDKDKNNLRNTKPPLSGWAIYKYYQHTEDAKFISRMYPRLKKYHSWWYKYRDHDGDSLCEYGCNDGTITAAKWESGMDNAVRFDHTSLVKNTEGSYTMNQESVDLNSYLYLEKLYMANMAWVLSKKEEAIHFENEATSLKKKIENKFYHSGDNYFYDIHYKNDSSVKVKGPEAWIPLFAKLTSYKNRRKVSQLMYKESEFNTFVPFPTVSASNPDFAPQEGYWRGPIWLDQAYFAIQGMRKVNMWDESNEMFKKLLNNPAGLKNQAPIYENYHPESGIGLNAPHFSWSAAHLLLLFRDEG